MTNKLNKPIKVVKAKDLSLAQATTLYRLRDVDIFRLRADLKLGQGLQMVDNCKSTFVSAPSIPVLYRLGLVDFLTGRPTASADQGKFFQVGLTSSGWGILREFDEAVG